MSDWRDQAACKGVDPDVFFPERGESQELAMETCAGCPVQQECLESGMQEYFGIWGKQSGRKRQELKRGHS